MCILCCSLSFSPVCVVIRQKTSSPRLPIPRSIAQETRCYVCMPIRALYLYAEPIVELLFLLYLYCTSCKCTCRAHFLLSMLSMASSRGKQVPHGTTTTLLNSAGARGQHHCTTRLGGWTQINIKEKNRVLLCAS